MFFSRQSHFRERKDTAIDTLLFLYLLDRASGKIVETNKLKAQIKLMKLVFLAEKEMFEDKQKGFNFFFNFYKHGPSSLELLNLIDDLKEGRLIKLEECNDKFRIKLSEKGKQVLRDFLEGQKSEVKKKNKIFFEKVEKVIEENKGLSAKDLEEKTHSLSITPPFKSREITIGDMSDDFRKKEKKTRLLMRMPDSFYKEVFKVDEGWVATLEVLCNPGLRELAED